MNKDFIFDPRRSLEDTLKLKIEGVDPQKGIVKYWSFSSLMEYETCPYRLFLKVVKGLRTEQHPKAARGVEVHDALESYVKGETTEIHEAGAKHFGKVIEQFREKYAEGRISCEEEWAFNRKWEIVDWNAQDVWGKVIQDVFEHYPGETVAHIYDYKTGRKDGNELKHSQQALVYAISAFKRYPEIEYIESDFLYLDQATNNRLKKSYTRGYIAPFIPRFEERVTRLTTDTDLIAKPSPGNCRWCSYGQANMCDWYKPA
jgi:CRISPR/Cas system-associated exonuclease Cas4 (RecB family)